MGNLEAVRDFTDVRDVVRAYWAAPRARRPPASVYNVCSGQGRRIRELLDLLLVESGAHVEVRVDPERLRPSDVPVLVGDPSPPPRGHGLGAPGAAPREPPGSASRLAPADRVTKAHARDPAVRDPVAGGTGSLGKSTVWYLA